MFARGKMPRCLCCADGRADAADYARHVAILFAAAQRLRCLRHYARVTLSAMPRERRAYAATRRRFAVAARLLLGVYATSPASYAHDLFYE